jgi:hypothetical protein
MIMFRSSRIVLVTSILMGLLCVPSPAQEKPPKSTLTDLGIEIVDGPHPHSFSVSSSEGGAIEIGPPPKRPDWKQPPDRAPLTRITIRSVLERDGVSIKIGGVFDDSYPAGAPGPKYGAKEQAIASYSAREGETITINELERFGFEPLVLRVVRFQPQPFPEPSAKVLPEVINALKSVAFVDLQSEEPVSHSYNLTLQNLAAKSIVALTVGTQQSHTESMEGVLKPLMLPGAIFKTSIGLSASIPPETSPGTLVIGTVLFDDGSYEGDVVAAAEMAARSKGRRIQFSRALQLLQGIPADQPPQETIRAIQEVKAAVEKLRIDVDPALVAELQSQFPLLPKANGKEWLAEKTMDGLKNGRHHALYLLNELEQKRARNQEGFDLNQSLTDLRERLARLAGNP